MCHVSRGWPQDEDLAATSTAVRVMGMQVQLVRCVYQLALRAQQTAQEAA